MRYFTTVNDNWDYSSGPERLSGKRFTAGIVPLFGWQNSDSHHEFYIPDITEHFYSRDLTLGIGIQAGYESEIPVNLHWQKSWSGQIGYGIKHTQYANIVSYSESESQWRDFTAGIYYGLGYYPNSRTDLIGE